MIVVGVCVVQDEASSVEVAVRHHLTTVCDRIVVVDTGSADGTLAILEGLVREGLPLDLRQGRAGDPAKTHTELSREAHADGADWVLPFACDELWTDRQGQSLRSILVSSAVGEIRADVVTFVQDGSVAGDPPAGLLKARWRVAGTVRPERAAELVEAGAASFVQIAIPPRAIHRPTAEVVVDPGNHAVHGARGRTEHSAWVSCLHLPLRSRGALDVKRQSGRRLAEGGGHRSPEHWPLLRWAACSDEGLDAEWRANSVTGGELPSAAGPVRVASDVRWATAVWRARRVTS